MGWFKTFLIGAAASKSYQNIYNKPILTPPSGFVIRSIKQKGLGKKWEVKYSKETSMNLTSTFTISGGVKSVSVGKDKFYIDWP